MDDGNAMAMPLELRKAETDAKLKASVEKFGRVFRSKGFVWIAGRDDVCGEWGHAGAVLQLGCGGPWMGLLPSEMWPEEGSDERDMLERDFVNPILMDRRQELVFIGQGMDPAHTRRALDACLLSEDETRAGLEYWRTLPDPFPDWGLEEAS